MGFESAFVADAIAYVCMVKNKSSNALWTHCVAYVDAANEPFMIMIDDHRSIRFVKLGLIDCLGAVVSKHLSKITRKYIRFVLLNLFISPCVFVTFVYTDITP